MKLNHNRSITIGDKIWNNIPIEKKKPSKFEKLNNKKRRKKIKEAYRQYGSLEEIRKARMKKQLKNGWVKENKINTESKF